MHQDQSASRDGARVAPSSEVSRISAAELFRGRTELIVEHNGEDYRLRITSKGKLILTK